MQKDTKDIFVDRFGIIRLSDIVHNFNSRLSNQHTIFSERIHLYFERFGYTAELKNLFFMIRCDCVKPVEVTFRVLRRVIFVGSKQLEWFLWVSTFFAVTVLNEANCFTFNLRKADSKTINKSLGFISVKLNKTFVNHRKMLWNVETYENKVSFL